MIAVWYHCKISGTGIPGRNDAVGIIRSQMDALQKSGLANAADQIHVGINGSQQDGLSVANLLPDKALVYVHGEGSRSELPTIAMLRSWLPSHLGWYVLYHHSKGVTNPGDPIKANHRAVMERALVWNWKTCVKDLQRGFDAVGVNLLDPQTRPSPFYRNERYFVGNFWWANTAYLLELPPIPETIRSWTDSERCLAEAWIGKCRRRPVLLDYERIELYQFWVENGRVKP